MCAIVARLEQQKRTAATPVDEHPAGEECQHAIAADGAISAIPAISVGIRLRKLKVRESLTLCGRDCVLVRATSAIPAISVGIHPRKLRMRDSLTPHGT